MNKQEEEKRAKECAKTITKGDAERMRKELQVVSGIAKYRRTLVLKYYNE